MLKREVAPLPILIPSEFPLIEITVTERLPYEECYLTVATTTFFSASSFHHCARNSYNSRWKN